MTQTPQAQVPQAQHAWVQVAVLGSELRQTDFVQGMTVRDALAKVEVEVHDSMMVQVNGKPADLDRELEPNSAVQVTTKVENG